MSIYGLIPLGNTLSGFVDDVQVQHEAIRTFERGTVAPTVLTAGLIWNRTDYAVIGDSLCWRTPGGTWTLLMDPEFAQLNAGGTVAMGADLPAGGFKLTGLAAGSAAGHSVRYEQVLLLSGANTMAAALPMGGFKVTGMADPTAAQDAATKAYVDAGGSYFQTNRDIRANSKPIKYVTDADSTRVCDLGFTPRRVVIFSHGDLRRESTNGLYGTMTDRVDEFHNWQDDAASGYTEASPQSTANFTVSGNTMKIEVTFLTGATKGIKIRFVGPSNNTAILRNAADSDDGALQVLAFAGGA